LEYDLYTINDPLLSSPFYGVGRWDQRNRADRDGLTETTIHLPSVTFWYGVHAGLFSIVALWCAIAATILSFRRVVASRVDAGALSRMGKFRYGAQL
jgi:hypothetical protein